MRDTRIILAALICGLALSASPALAQPTRAQLSEAEARFQRGGELYNVRNFEGALVEFQRAYELTQHEGLLYNLARCYLSLGRYPEAARSIERYLAEARDLPAERRAEVEQMLAETRSFIARIDLTVEPSNARVTLTLDGDALASSGGAAGLAVSPGRHTLEARAEGWETARESVVVASGDRRAVRLVLRHAAAAQGRLVVASTPPGTEARVDGAVVALPSVAVAPGEHTLALSAPGYAPWNGRFSVDAGGTRVVTASLTSTRGLAPVWVIAGASATGAFLVAGVVFGALTASAHDEYTAYYRDQFDDPAVADLRGRGETYRALTNVSFGLAAAAGIATVVFATQMRARRPSTVNLSFAPTPGGAAAGLRFTF